MSDLVTVTIDDVQYQVEPGRNLLDVCLSLKLDLPYFCWHPAMGSVGACRQCAVMQYWTDRRGQEQQEIVMACMTPAEDGARIAIDHPEARRFRARMIELLMTSHPHDCPVCDEGGECHLQDMTVMTGHVYRRYRFRKRTYRNQDLGPFVTHEMNRCIACYRCVRFYRDYAGGDRFRRVLPAQPGVLRAQGGRRPAERVQRQPRGGVPHGRLHRQDAGRPLHPQVGPADGAVRVPPLRRRLRHHPRRALRRAAPRAGQVQPPGERLLHLRPRALRLRVRERAAAAARAARARRRRRARGGRRRGGRDAAAAAVPRPAGRRRPRLGWLAGSGGRRLRPHRRGRRRRAGAAHRGAAGRRARRSASARRVPRWRTTSRCARWSGRSASTWVSRSGSGRSATSPSRCCATAPRRARPSRTSRRPTSSSCSAPTSPTRRRSST